MGYKSNKKEILKAIEKAEERVLYSMAEAGNGFIKALTPVGQYPAGSGRVGGNLRNGNEYEIDTKEKKDTFYNNVKYAPHVELGTRYQQPQSFLREGIEGNKKALREIAKKELSKID